VSGLILPDSVPGQVIRAVRERRVIPVASWGLADEIARVLRRPKLRAYRISEEDVAAVLELLAPFLPTIESRISSRDPNDSVVIEAALSGEAEAIVTGDADLLDDDDLRRRLAQHAIRVVTPAEWVEMLGRSL
jgi:putative PIN family toxin of toxin-antitoxin system